MQAWPSKFYDLELDFAFSEKQNGEYIAETLLKQHQQRTWSSDGPIDQSKLSKPDLAGVVIWGRIQRSHVPNQKI